MLKSFINTSKIDKRKIFKVVKERRYMEEKVLFYDSNKNKVIGILANPKKENKEIVILLHGFASSKNSQTNIALQKILTEHKIATFRFDFYGHGESEGNFENITVTK